MKFLVILGCSAFILIVLIIRAKFYMNLPEDIQGEDLKKYRRRSYIPAIVVWILCTLYFAYEYLKK